MRLFFIQGGSRLKRDSDGNWYTDSNFDNSVWDRYKTLCDELIVVLRREERVYDPYYAKERFSPVDECDRAIIHSGGNSYLAHLGERRRKANSPYPSEMTGFIYEGLAIQRNGAEL